ncbi:hypothetical protein CHELA20_52067 [Hyphomicrobiales bacterium]|nr:hypothetical protein CHELA41_22855 [Hyphomicrobiales bacterium]CAH1680396.1 hypothetical protein CHELA20_52067 [Hyphomicrobiales bacterium]
MPPAIAAAATSNARFNMSLPHKRDQKMLIEYEIFRECIWFHDAWIASVYARNTLHFRILRRIRRQSRLVTAIVGTS